MVVLKPFTPYMPKQPEEVAAAPYDVVSTEEAKRDIEHRPNSFLCVDKPEALEDGLSLEEWGERARTELERLYDTEMTERPSGFYVYRLTAGGRRQTGLVATFSVADYENGRIKIHEHTREVKERERVEHVAATKAHTGPILMSHQVNPGLKQILNDATEGEPLFAFTDEQHVLHEGFMIPTGELARIIMIGATIPAVYIADGHHRAKAAAVVAQANATDDMNQSERAHFLGVLFPSDELTILPYHRLMSDVTPEEVGNLLEGLSFSYDVSEEEAIILPKRHGEFGIAYRGNYYRAVKRQATSEIDVAILQRDILEPYFNVTDIRSDPRVDFVGGNVTAKQLSQLTAKQDVLVLTCHATTMEQLIDVSDAGGQMPPKSTWFEPKLKSGLFVHRFDE